MNKGKEKKAVCMQREHSVQKSFYLIQYQKPTWKKRSIGCLFQAFCVIYSPSWVVERYMSNKNMGISQW